MAETAEWIPTGGDLNEYSPFIPRLLRNAVISRMNDESMQMLPMHQRQDCPDRPFDREG